MRYGSLIVAFVIAVAIPSFAQQTVQVIQTEQKHLRGDTVPARDDRNLDEYKTDKPTSKETDGIMTGLNLVTKFIPDAKESLKIDYSPVNIKQQKMDGDDSMMGVMGKGTDSIKLGGHIGFVVPITSRGGGNTTLVGRDRFVFGFPVGLTVKTKSNFAVDFEFIPTFNTGNDFVLTIHPGILYGFKKKYVVGVRAAYDAGAGSYGFTPLIARGFKINDKLGWFIEADFPVRSNYRPFGDRFASFAIATHSGITF